VSGIYAELIRVQPIGTSLADNLNISDNSLEVTGKAVGIGQIGFIINTIMMELLHNGFNINM